MARYSTLLQFAATLLILTMPFFRTAIVRAEPVGSLTATHLRCEYTVDPMGVDLANPRLYWQVESAVRNQIQTAYQILVASSQEQLDRNVGDLWDSGRVQSDRTTAVSYAGGPLKSMQRVFWKVRVWDRNKRPSSWSKTATWTMGILSPNDWQAKWIAAVPDSESPPVPARHVHGGTNGGADDTPARYPTVLARRSFKVQQGLSRAVISLCGLGCYELTVNGRKQGDALFPPGWSKYDKTCLYDTYDVTRCLQPGANVLGLELGNGMYRIYAGGRYAKLIGSFGPPKAIAQLRLEYKDGSVTTLVTDQHWQVAPGPITYSSIFGGEDMDARRLQQDWNQPGFDTSTWAPALVTTGPGGQLRGLSCAAPPIRAVETLQKAKIKKLSPSVLIVDFGQNASLMPRIQVQGDAGSAIRMIPAELLKPDGTVDRGSAGGGPCWWQYTLAGKGKESWFPKFFYHGCRYIQVELRPARPGGPLPALLKIAGVVVHSSSEPVGQFRCSNDLMNRIHRLVRWAQRSNMMSVLTDCPHRERLGWLEQYHLNGPSLRYEFDLARLFTKGMNDMADSQRPNGLIPDIAPEYVIFNGGFVDSPEWGSAFVLVPWQQYLWEGDLQLLRQYYDRMARYVHYLGSKAQDDIVNYGLGDWYDIGPGPPGVAQLTPIALTATAFYYQDTVILANVAHLLDKPEDAARYKLQAERIRQAFNGKFYRADKGHYATGSQASNAIPLVMELVDPKNRKGVLQSLVDDVRTHGDAMTAGDVGYRYLLRALAEGGRSDVIFAMNNQIAKPGYGYQLKMGATSLTEAWNAKRQSSQNHFMLGQINEWFYHDLAGIGTDPSGPGFKKILIRPQPVGDITEASAEYRSIHGRIVSHWTRNNGSFTLEVTIPANTSATVFLPAIFTARITEGDRSIGKDHPAITQHQRTSTQAVYRIGSGNYRFQATSQPLDGKE